MCFFFIHGKFSKFVNMRQYYIYKNEPCDRTQVIFAKGWCKFKKKAAHPPAVMGLITQIGIVSQ